MRSLLGLGLVLAACTLDPRAVLGKASLRVQVEGLTAEGRHLVVTARDESGRQLVKRATVAGEASVEMVFEDATELKGVVDLGAVLRDAAGDDLACGMARGDSGATAPVTLAMTTADDDSNCGQCGRSCSGADHATRVCEPAARACGALTCAAGWFDVNLDPSDGCETTCASPSPEASVAACSDGLDNDCDGQTDCDDDDCQGFTRACTFGACSGEERWACATNTWGACSSTAGLESTPEACSDGLDNDCDGKTDCDDEGCGAIARDCSVQACAGRQLYVCASHSFDTCAVDDLLESTIATCSDGLDNDCDGKTDCDDPKCLNIQQACTGVNLCVAGVKTWLCSVKLFTLCLPYVSVAETSDLVCRDGLDNDCDGKTDCKDPDCSGHACALGKVCCPNGTCAATCG